jgi:hypothetical protein
VKYEEQQRGRDRFGKRSKEIVRQKDRFDGKEKRRPSAFLNARRIKSVIPIDLKDRVSKRYLEEEERKCGAPQQDRGKKKEETRKEV